MLFKNSTGENKRVLLKIVYTITAIFAFMILLPYYHLFLFWYNSFIIEFCKYECDGVNIGTLGDSLAALSFAFLAYSLIQSSKSLKITADESKQNRNEMRLQRHSMQTQNRMIEQKQAEILEHKEEIEQYRKNIQVENKKKGILEVMENLRLLTDNLESEKILGDNENEHNIKEYWKSESKNKITKANLSLLIQDSLEILAEIRRHEEGLLRDFAEYVIDDNLRRLNSKDFSGRNLSYINLSGAWLYDANLNDANLTSTKMQGAILSNTSFKGANMQDTRMDHTDLKNADLRGAKGLTEEQLSKVTTLFATKLPSNINVESFKAKHPHLFINPVQRKPF